MTTKIFETNGRYMTVKELYDALFSAIANGDCKMEDRVLVTCNELAMYCEGVNVACLRLSGDERPTRSLVLY